MPDYIRDLRRAKWGAATNLRRKTLELLMSALGQKQTSRHLQPMSALPPKADMKTFGYSEGQLGKMILYGLCHQYQRP
jgi:hypothetical protein